MQQTQRPRFLNSDSRHIHSRSLITITLDVVEDRNERSEINRISILSFPSQDLHTEPSKGVLHRAKSRNTARENQVQHAINKHIRTAPPSPTSIA